MSTLSPFTPAFQPGTTSTADQEPARIQAIISALKMFPLVEGGYFVETDRDPLLIPSPFPSVPMKSVTPAAGAGQQAIRPGFDPAWRNASTSIFYLITPSSPQGTFHRNRARNVHTLHHGRGRYIVIHPNEEDDDKRVETFIVGPNVAAGERLQWIVEGGTYKASFLLPDEEGGDGSDGGLLISETVVPGFEFYDHDFLEKDALREMVGEKRAGELEWLVREE
ncbi:RmlC-like cupin domain-containing protein [Podospora appendiculata]|uniref:RmlC-like cupin domain-containing protein n=1 Tax=Podospora appendiculata TaxID=314037 RepID=A0AAE0X6B4_9PEZI|nr:RmlC-like cupin domain-containing protein [Podospora appendiculata]